MELTVLDDFLQEQMKKESHSFKKKQEERKKESYDTYDFLVLV